MSHSSLHRHAWPLTLLLLASVVTLSTCRQPTTWTPKPPYGDLKGTNDFDLTSAGNDTNGSPDSPLWAPQDPNPDNFPPTPNSKCVKSNSQPYQKGCTDQAKYLVQDTGSGLNGALCDLFGLLGGSSSLNGHIDWTVAGAHGAIGWLNYAEDFDYNLLLLPNKDYGLTQDNNSLSAVGDKYVEVEFDSRELEDRFATPWWHEFAHLVTDGSSSGNYDQLIRYLRPKNREGLACGVVYGLFDLDCEHGCRTEFHPAYAVAIQIDESNDTNTWAIFARNWGDEGFCSHLDHQLDLDSAGGAIHLLLPYNSPDVPSSIKIKEFASSSSPGQCPRFAFAPNAGESIEIPLPPPGNHGLTEVVVQFTWPAGASPVACKSGADMKNFRKMLAGRKSATAAPPNLPESAEERLGRLFRLVNQGKGFSETKFRSDVLQKYSTRPSAAKHIAALPKQFEQKNTPSSCVAPEVSAALPPTAAAAPKGPIKRPHHRLPSYASKEIWDQAMLAKFCDAYKTPEKQKLLSGEPPEVVQKLDKICSNKRVKP